MATIGSSSTHAAGGHISAGEEAGFSFQRSFRNTGDWLLLVPVWMVAPIVIIAAVMKAGFGMCLNGCRYKPAEAENEREYADMFGDWPRCPSHREQDSINSKAGCRFIAEPVCVPSADMNSITEEGSGTCFTMSPSLPPSSLAAKLRVDRLDLSATHEENYSYEITGNRIKYKKDSWRHKLHSNVCTHRQVAWSIIVCFVVPVTIFLLLFFLRSEDRVYEMFSGRGGCRVSRSSGYTDWVRETTIEILAACAAVLGLIFSALAVLHFRKQNGVFNINIKNLTPSPEVLRLYNSTKVVRQYLALCLCLNIILVVSSVASLGLYGFSFKAFSPQRPSTTVQDALQELARNFVAAENRVPTPLFRYTLHDQEAYHFIISFLLIVISFAFLLWSRLCNWSSCLREYFNPLMEDGCSGEEEDVNPFPFPFTSNVLREQEFRRTRHKSRSDNAPSVISIPSEAKSPICNGHEANSTTPQESYLGNPGKSHCRDSRSTENGSSASALSSSACQEFEGTIDVLERDQPCFLAAGENGPTLLPEAALPSVRQSYSSSWLPSAPVHGYTLPKALYGARMMGQYLQLSRRTASFTSFVSLAPLSESSMNGPGLDFTGNRPHTRLSASSVASFGMSPSSVESEIAMFESRKTVQEYVCQVHEKIQSRENTDSSAGTSKSRPISPPPSSSRCVSPARNVDTIANHEVLAFASDIVGSRASSHSRQVELAYMDTLPVFPYCHKSTPSSLSFGSHSSLPGTERLRRESGSSTSSYLGLHSGAKDVSETLSLNATDMSISTANRPTEAMEVGIQQDDVCYASKSGVDYDQVLEKLAKSKWRLGHGSHISSQTPKKTAMHPKVSQAYANSDGSDSGMNDADDVFCDTETMGAISLEELVCDDPRTEYDAIHQIMAPKDDKEMLQDVVHYALQSGSLCKSADAKAYTRHSRERTRRLFSRHDQQRGSSESQRTQRSQGRLSVVSSTLKQTDAISYADSKDSAQGRSQSTLDTASAVANSKIVAPLIDSPTFGSLSHTQNVNHARKTPCNSTINSRRSFGHRRQHSRPGAPLSVEIKSRAATKLTINTLEIDAAKPDSPMMPFSSAGFFCIKTASEPIDSASIAVATTLSKRGSVRRHSVHFPKSSMDPASPPAIDGVAAERNKEGHEFARRVYSPRLARMIAVPSGAPPPVHAQTQAQCCNIPAEDTAVSVSAPPAAAVVKEEVSIHAVEPMLGWAHHVDMVLTMGPLPPAPLEAPPIPPSSVLAHS
ncbi:hypothetical protein EDD11_005222 [Mortierella claussenii]|nr:hypothetical protein EDD11_005222 [Mortierella claussenii]